jgi:hypothetical protein
MKFSLLYTCPLTLEIGQPPLQWVRLLPRDEAAVMALPTDTHLAPTLIGRAVTLLCHCTFTAYYRILLITSMRFKLCMKDGSQIIAWKLATNRASV